MTATTQRPQTTARPLITPRQIHELGAALAYFRQHFGGWTVWRDAAGGWTATRPVWDGEARHEAGTPSDLAAKMLGSRPVVVPRPDQTPGDPVSESNGGEHGQGAAREAPGSAERR